MDTPFTADDLRRFETDGYLRLEDAIPPELVAACADILWKASGCDPDDRSTWTQPVIRLPHLALAPFREAANTPRLHAAYDQLAGAGNWQPQGGLGTFPLRFPSPEDPGDAGWHVDVSFDTEAPNFLDWRANHASKGRALLMLFLFSDVGALDAPTRLRLGSHLQIARQLAPAGEAGLTLGELAANGFAESADCEEAIATGPAGTVFLCHPFLVHAAQPHRGRVPRFMAQPPLLPVAGHLPGEADTPVGRAIRGA
ncbi:phytanoyl-CoA dioxygenase family protein [Pseudoroseicyclus sp. CXY001]|uniref:phytanoyl-CoA dioxygenase family protein n=1 Tax=Pseudoroseicyclus sp. CXY001 TaxID=3242492 RepID=UPI003570BD06